MRGEQAELASYPRSFLGSPPLARGTAVPLPVCAIALRITPACAGNSFHHLHNPQVQKDHPRLRGEQTEEELKKIVRLGSPPLARGTASCSYRRCAIIGITPACAGNRRNSCFSCTRLQDHPRLRGEQLGKIYFINGNMGSPPLARGTAHAVICSRKACGITPACAGNSFIGKRIAWVVKDHPRLRGEQQNAWCCFVFA